MSRNGQTSWQRKFDWQPQPTLWQFEASENVCRRVIITINEPEFHSFAGQDQHRSTALPKGAVADDRQMTTRRSIIMGMSRRALLKGGVTATVFAPALVRH